MSRRLEPATMAAEWQAGRRIAALMLVMVLSCIGTKAFAEDVIFDDGTFNYEVLNETDVAVTGLATGCDLTELTIPETASDGTTDWNVTNVGAEAFSGKTNITSVVIGDNVTSIGSMAFCNCTGLTSVTFGKSVAFVGYDAFKGCDENNLKTIVVKDLKKWCQIDFVNGESYPLNCAGHLYLNGNAVEDIVTTLDESNLGGVTSINNFVFRCNRSLTSVTIPSSVKSIGNEAFADCNSLTSVTIPSSVETIGLSAFGDCTNITEVIVEDITKWCGVDFGNNLSNPLCCAMKVHLYRYKNGKKEEITTLSEEDLSGITRIGSFVFDSFYGLTSVTIPSSVTSIGEYAFSGCSSLVKVIVKDIVAWCEIAFGNCASNPLYCANHLYLNTDDKKNRIKTLSEENLKGVTKIGKFAFHHCVDLTPVAIPSCVTTIGQNAFYGCTGLISVNIGESVTSIGDEAFSECNNLTSVTIPD